MCRCRYDAGPSNAITVFQAGIAVLPATQAVYIVQAVDAAAPSVSYPYLCPTDINYDRKRGGVGTGSGLVVMRHDPKGQIWTYAAALAPYRTRFSVAGLSGRLYVVGGLGEDCLPTSTVLSIDPATGHYTAAAPLKFAHPAHLSTPLGLSLVAVESKAGSRRGGSVMYASCTRTNPIARLIGVGNVWVTSR